MLAESVIIWREKSACVHSGITKLPPRQGAGRIISFYFSISIAKLNTFIAGNYIHTYSHTNILRMQRLREFITFECQIKGKNKVYVIIRIFEYALE